MRPSLTISLLLSSYRRAAGLAVRPAAGLHSPTFPRDVSSEDTMLTSSSYVPPPWAAHLFVGEGGSDGVAPRLCSRGRARGGGAGEGAVAADVGTAAAKFPPRR